jgi:hypothetical protein
MKRYLTILILFISIKTFACTCAPKKLSEWQKSEIENSECIFIGEVIEVNKTDLTFKIKVIESLDGGDEKGNTYIGKNWKSCSPYVSEKGKWIIYGHMEDGFLRLNMCGISRTFKNPMVYPSLPPREFFEKKLSESEQRKILKNLEIKDSITAKTNLNNEIIALRKLRNFE